MSYSYSEERKWVFTEEGQVQFLSIRDRANYLIKEAGAATMEKMIAGESGSGWEMMACVDRLVELGELVEVTDERVPGQYRIFRKAYS